MKKGHILSLFLYLKGQTLAVKPFHLTPLSENNWAHKYTAYAQISLSYIQFKKKTKKKNFLLLKYKNTETTFQDTQGK